MRARSSPAITSLPALQAGAIYEERYPLASALGRPLIAKQLVAIARMEGAAAVAHGCTGKDNDQVGLDVVRARARSVDGVIAPARIWGMSARQTRSSTREARNIPVPDDHREPLQHRLQSVGTID